MRKLAQDLYEVFSSEADSYFWMHMSCRQKNKQKAVLNDLSP